MAETRCLPAATPPTRAWNCAIRTKLAGRNAIHHYNYGSTQRGDDRGVAAYGKSVHPISGRTMRPAGKAIYVNRLMTVGIVDMPQEEGDPVVPGCWELEVRLYPCLAGGRPAGLGQQMLDARAHRFSFGSAPVDAHDGQGHRAAVSR